MALQGLFFNAFPDENYPTGYDRNYNANDIANWFKVFITTGVVKDGFKVLANSGLDINVSTGTACIEGHGVLNNALYPLTIDTAPTGSSSRYDLVVLRLNNIQVKSGRQPELLVIKGTSSIPTEASLTRTNDTYDLLLAYIEVRPNATSVVQADITDTRGDVELCPWTTAVKGYEDYYDAIVQQYESNITLASAGKVVVTDLSTKLYNNKYSLIEVYCNGLKEEDNAYTIGTDSEYITITFVATKSAGAKISVVLNNFIDGEGLENVMEQYNELVNDVQNLKTAFEYTYLCNGLNDNVLITNLVNEFINGGTDYGSMRLKIVGNFGCMNGGSYPLTVGGSGTSASPYKIFSFNSGNRKVVLDFYNCGQINVPISGVVATIFHSEGNVSIKGLNLVANGTNSGTTIVVFDDKEMVCEDSRFWVNGYSNSKLAVGGTFTNCRGSLSNASGNSFCFLNTGVLRLNGGEYLAYTGQNGSRSAVVGQSVSGSIAILNGLSAPTNARSGYYQTNSIYQPQSGNYIRSFGLISALATFLQGDNYVVGSIAVSL